MHAGKNYPRMADPSLDLPGNNTLQTAHMPRKIWLQFDGTFTGTSAAWFNLPGHIGLITDLGERDGRRCEWEYSETFSGKVYRILYSIEWQATDPKYDYRWRMFEDADLLFDVTRTFNFPDSSVGLSFFSIGPSAFPQPAKLSTFFGVNGIFRPALWSEI